MSYDFAKPRKEEMNLWWFSLSAIKTDRDWLIEANKLRCEIFWCAEGTIGYVHRGEEMADFKRVNVKVDFEINMILSENDCKALSYLSSNINTTHLFVEEIDKFNGGRMSSEMRENLVNFFVSAHKNLPEALKDIKRLRENLYQ